MKNQCLPEADIEGKHPRGDSKTGCVARCAGGNVRDENVSDQPLLGLGVDLEL